MSELFDLQPEPEQRALATVRSLPDFNIETLLTFLPDIKLKHNLEALTAEALAVDVKADGGLELADEKLNELKSEIKATERCFDDPVAMANALHKRMTGLRADFCKAASLAVDEMSRRVYAETRRREQLAREEKQRQQAEADRLAREAAARARATAEKSGAAAPVLQQLDKMAKTATAPPVAGPPAPKLTSSMSEKYEARLVADGGQPAAVADMTEPERVAFSTLVEAVAEGRAPLSCLVPDWKYLNGRAKGEKTAFQIAGLVAVDVGSVRKGGRS